MLFQRYVMSCVCSGGPAFLLEIRGDWKWHREAMNMKVHFTAPNVCHLCHAQSSGVQRPGIP